MNLLAQSKFILNNFFNEIKLKKQYINNLKNKVLLLQNIKNKNFKYTDYSINDASNKIELNGQSDNLVTYIINISFTQTNTTSQIMDSSGKLLFFYSAGIFKYSGKSKKARFYVFRDLYNAIVSKLKFLKSKPTALHLTNVGSNRFWIIKKLRKKFFIKVVRFYNSYPYNGCRKRKMRRKKFKKS